MRLNYFLIVVGRNGLRSKQNDESKHYLTKESEYQKKFRDDINPSSIHLLDQHHTFTPRILHQPASHSPSTLIAPARHHWPVPFSVTTSFLHLSSFKMCITTYTRGLCSTCGFLVTYNIDITHCFFTGSESCREQQADPVVVNTKVQPASCKKCTGASTLHSQKVVCDVWGGSCDLANAKPL